MRLLGSVGPYHRAVLKAYAAFTWRIARYMYFAHAWSRQLYEVAQQWLSYALESASCMSGIDLRKQEFPDGMLLTVLVVLATVMILVFLRSR